MYMSQNLQAVTFENLHLNIYCRWKGKNHSRPTVGKLVKAKENVPLGNDSLKRENCIINNMNRTQLRGNKSFLFTALRQDTHSKTERERKRDTDVLLSLREKNKLCSQLLEFQIHKIHKFFKYTAKCLSALIDKHIHLNIEYFTSQRNMP